MNIFRGVFQNNRVTRDNLRMTIPALESGLDQTCGNPIPMSIAHDIERVIGISGLIAILIQPKLVTAIGEAWVAETDQDLVFINQVAQKSFDRHTAKVDQDKVAELKHRLAQQLSLHAELRVRGGVAFYDSGLAVRTFPEIFDHQDDDGLIPMNELQCFAPGVFLKDGLLLFAHPFFRRSLSRNNTLNDTFLNRLSETSDLGTLDVRIALDEDLIGHPDTYKREIEQQHWWGPMFSDNLDEMPVGVTKHSASEREQFFNGVSATEFFWHDNGKQRVFECEEIRDLVDVSHSLEGANYGCRYVHSIPTPKDSLPHLDGAVRLYTDELMLKRFDNDISKFGKDCTYKKLWRVDGVVPIDTWKMLINDYFRDNHLVGEYLGGIANSDDRVIVETDSKLTQDSLYSFCPSIMHRGDGVRIAVSYHPLTNKEDVRQIVSTEEYSAGGVPFPYLEAPTIDLVKYFARKGTPLSIPTATYIIAYEDLVTNLPLIEHTGSDAVVNAQRSLDIIRNYILELPESDGDRLISFRISAAYNDRQIYFSFMGVQHDIQIWLRSPVSDIPSATMDMGQWMQKASEFEDRSFNAAEAHPVRMEWMAASGMVRTSRIFLIRSDYSLSNSEEGSEVTLYPSEDVERARPFIENEGLAVAPAYILKASSCVKCQAPYSDCDCIASLDDSNAVDVTDATFSGLFWTNRPATPIDLQLTIGLG